MIIALRSEVDSRVLLYPLLKVLKSYGSIVVVSSNRVLRRLEDGDNGGFRNIRIIVEEGGGTDDIYEMYDISPDDYNFIILDNVGVTEVDKTCIILGAKTSPAFDDDVQLMMDTDDEDKQNISIFQFGKPQAKSSSQQSKSSSSSKKNSSNLDDDDDYDPAEKFKEASKASKSGNRKNKTYNAKFPLMQQLEDVEAEYRFYDVDSAIVDGLFNLLEDVVLVDKISFQKEVRKRDEGSNNFKGR